MTTIPITIIRGFADSDNDRVQHRDRFIAREIFHTSKSFIRSRPELPELHVLAKFVELPNP